MNPGMDILAGNASGMQASGSVAQRLLSSGMNVNALRTNDTLRKDEWITYDTTVVEIARERLGGVTDLVSAGLRYDLPNAMGTTKLEWERITDMDPAEMSMSGVTAGRGDRQLFDLTSLPIPLIHKEFSINIRTLMASRTTGQSLDTTQAAMATRLVTEKTEDLLFNGSNIIGTNNQIYGYTTAPARNTGVVTANWLTATGEQMLGDLLTMIDQAVQDNMYGPYMVYVPNGVYTHMGDDYKANSDKTIMQRLKEVPGILDIKPSARITDSTILLIQFTSDVVDMVIGQQPTPISWDTNGGMTMNFKVISIMVPRIKDDLASQSGIVHFSL